MTEQLNEGIELSIALAGWTAALGPKLAVKLFGDMFEFEKEEDDNATDPDSPA